MYNLINTVGEIGKNPKRTINSLLKDSDLKLALKKMEATFILRK